MAKRRAQRATAPTMARALVERVAAGMAVEDALVLAEEVGRVTEPETAFSAFMARRYPRARLVVENSVEIGRLEQAGAPPAAQTEVVERSLRALAESF